MGVLAFGEVVADLSRMEIHRNGQIDTLTVQEADLLRFLWEHRERVVSREVLLEKVWRYRPELATRTVDNTVSRLRAKLEPNKDPIYLKTVYGHGYMLTGVLPAPLPAPLPPEPCTNLGAERSSFVGRQAELARLQELLAEHRLVTLVGPAGCGKTRLAQQHARASFAQFPGGVWEVPLVEVSEPSGLISALARVLRAEATADAVSQALAERGRVLLVLDNLEQALSAAAEVLPGWLRASAQVVLLCTSRLPLRLQGEALVELGPLPLGTAVDLLRVRAGALGAELAPTDEPALQELVLRLDRLPLAIELAAARLRAWSPQDIAQRLASSLGVLGPGFRDAPPRHASLEQALAWSWALLDEAQQHALQGCAVFHGGLGLEAAEEVLLVSDSPSRIETLVEHSLMFVERRAHRVRYRLYESVRLFVSERTPPERHQELCLRHARHFARWAWALVHHPEAPALWDELELELDNLVAAWSVLAGREPQQACQLAVAISRARSTHVPGSVADELLTLTLEGSSPQELRCAVLCSRGRVRVGLGQLDAAVHDLEQALQAEEPELRCEALHWLAFAVSKRGETARSSQLAEALVGEAEQGAARWLPRALFLRASATDTERALALAREAGDRLTQRAASESQAAAAYRRGHFEEAYQHALEAGEGSESVIVALIGLERYEQAENALHDAIARCGWREDHMAAAFYSGHLARLLQWLGRLDEAHELATETRAFCAAHGMQPGEAGALHVLAAVAQERGDLEQALALLQQRWNVGATASSEADLRWELGERAPALAAYARSISAYTAAGAVMEAERARLRRAGLLALGEPDAGREEARQSACEQRAVWVNVARGLALGMADLVSGAIGQKEVASLAEQAMVQAPVWPVRFLARRLIQARSP